HGDDPVAAPEREAVKQGPLAAWVIRVLPAVLGKQDRRPERGQPPHHRIEKRRVLICGQHVDSFAAEKVAQSPSTAQVQARSPRQYLDGEPFFFKFFTQDASLLETGKHEPTTVL